MTSYTARITLAVKLGETLAEQLMDKLAEYHPAVGRGTGGRVDVVISYSADDLRQAVATGLAVAESASERVAVAVDVQTTDDYDRQLDLTPIPDLASVSDAAAALGVSRQAVLERLDRGTLPGQKVGNTWVLPQSALTA